MEELEERGRTEGRTAIYFILAYFFFTIFSQHLTVPDMRDDFLSTHEVAMTKTVDPILIPTLSPDNTIVTSKESPHIGDCIWSL